MDEVRELTTPGNKERVATLPTTDSEDVRTILQELAPMEPGPGVQQVSCWPTTAKGPNYAFVLDTGRIAYVSGERIEKFDGAFRDKKGPRLAQMAQRLLLGARMAGPGVRRAGECDECSHPNPGEIFECFCGDRSLPQSLHPWRHERVISHNNCYSYIWNKRMCDDQGGALVADVDHYSLNDVLAGVERDGLEYVTDQEFMAAQGKASPHRFVALMADDTGGYHFLRLDEMFWTHKVGTHIVSTCDLDRRPIPWFGLSNANIDPALIHRRYYRVPFGLTLPHCF